MATIELVATYIELSGVVERVPLYTCTENIHF